MASDKPKITIDIDLALIGADRALFCQDCGARFLFSAGEQEFFRLKGLVNVPKRCGNCRLVAKRRRNGDSIDNIAESNCTKCGVVTKLPFVPRGDRPIYCFECLRIIKFEACQEGVEA